MVPEKMSDNIYNWKKPLCFIESGLDGLSVNKQTLDELRKIKVPVCVVSIVGLYRTGKSYLLNLLAGHTSGFDVGSTIEAKTKGIWIWCVPHPNKSQECLALLDTEGLGDAKKGDNTHDAQIAVLATLLSSTFVYNSIGTIDQRALDNLHFVTNMSEHVKTRATTDEEDGTEFVKVFPNFIWCVRDFVLKLEIGGKSCTEDDYLEDVLTTKKGTSKKVSDYNLPRQCLKEYFPSRKCFIFPRPAATDNDMKALETIGIDALNPDFLSAAKKFEAYVIASVNPKYVEGNKLTGSGLAELGNQYTSAIRNGAVPCIENAIESVAKIENTKAVEEGLAKYRELMGKVSLPTETLEILSDIHHDSEKQAIATFMQLSILIKNNKYQEKLAQQIQKEFKEKCRENVELSMTGCSALLEDLHRTLIQENINSGKYSQPGSYNLYKTDMESLEKKYNAAPGKGIMASTAYSKFTSMKECEGASILHADKSMTEAAKQLEEQQRKTKEEALQREEAEKEAERNRKLAEDAKTSQLEHIRQLEWKIEQIKSEKKPGFFESLGNAADAFISFFKRK